MNRCPQQRRAKFLIVRELPTSNTVEELHGTYKGNGLDVHGEPLRGKAAILQYAGGSIVSAQFDDVFTGMSFGWFPYDKSEWDIRKAPAE